MTSFGGRANRSSISDYDTDTIADNAFLHRLQEAIAQDNLTAIMCMKTAMKDCSEEQWNRVFNQLDSRHQAYVQQKTQQHNNELHELQEMVRRNLASERRLLDEQLANHRSAIITTDNLAERSNESVHSTGGVRKSRDFGDLAPSISLEERRHLYDHLTEQPPATVSVATVGAAVNLTDLALADEVNRLRAALAAKERELASAEDRQARCRRLCDDLLGRLSAAEAELQFLRNRRTDRRVSVGLVDDAGAVVDNSGDTGAVDSLRRSLAHLERRQLIDTADALELPGDPGELERRYDCLQVERREVETALTHMPRPGSVHHTWHSARDQDMLEKKLDNIDRELVHLRNSLKQFQLI